MKTKSFLITVALMASCLGDETKKQEQPKNAEIEKIDARLAELSQIWKDDTAIINRLTNFKRTPVQQGSQAYNTCLQSSQRIQQAEAEAKTLKTKKAALAGGKSLPAGDSDSDSNAADPFSSGKRIESATKNATELSEERAKQYDQEAKNREEAEKKVTKNELFEVIERKIPSVAYDRKLHGPKVKDLFIGMSMSDFSGKVGLLVGEPYRISEAIKDDAGIGVIVNGLKSPPVIAVAKGAHAILPKDDELGMMRNNVGIWGLAKPEGSVSLMVVSGATSKLLFKATTIRFEEFVQNFEEGYGVTLHINVENGTYDGITEEGVKIEIRPDFGVTIGKVTKPEDTKKAFD